MRHPVLTTVLLQEAITIANFLQKPDFLKTLRCTRFSLFIEWYNKGREKYKKENTDKKGS
jgi:hypothetical protein